MTFRVHWTKLSLKLFELSISTRWTWPTFTRSTRIRFHQELLRFNVRLNASFLFSSLLASITSYLFFAVCFQGHSLMTSLIFWLLFKQFSQLFTISYALLGVIRSQNMKHNSRTSQLKQFWRSLDRWTRTWHSPFWVITLRSRGVRLPEKDLQFPAPIFTPLK